MREHKFCHFIITIVLFIFCNTNVYAQDEQGIVSAEIKKSFIESVMENKLVRGVTTWFNATDSLYITPEKYNLTLKLEESTWFEHYHLRSYNSDQRQVLGFAPMPSSKLGLYLGWRWVSVGYSLDFNSLGGRKDNKRTEIAMHFHSARFGLDLYYRKTGSNYRITKCENFNLSNDYIGTPFNGFKSNIKGLNTFYIFNSKRFSYPAAYAHSTIQKKSCGSFLSGLSFTKHDITFDHKQLPEEIQQQIKPELCFKTLSYADYNISFGYSYNLAFKRNCLFNITVLPALGYKRARINNIDSPEYESIWTGWMKDINFDLITRTGVVWNNNKYYIGISLTLNTYDYRKDKFSMTNSFGSLRIYSGFNFWKRKGR